MQYLRLDSVLLGGDFTHFTFYGFSVSAEISTGGPEFSLFCFNSSSMILAIQFKLVYILNSSFDSSVYISNLRLYIVKCTVFFTIFKGLQGAILSPYYFIKMCYCLLNCGYSNSRLDGSLDLIKGDVIGQLCNFLVVEEKETGYTKRKNLLNVVIPVLS